MKVNLLSDKINRMFLLLFLSAAGSTIIMTIYSTVDMICVGQYCGPLGASAIACINPMWSIMIAPGVLVGVGGAIMIANRRGSGNGAAANEYFTLGALIALVFSVAIALVFLFFSEPLLRYFEAEGEVLTLSMDYMRSIAIVSPAFTMCACISTYVRNDGEAMLPTIATVTGGVVNVVLDILLVFDFGAGLGAAGAGIATAIGQVVAFLTVLSYFFRKGCTLRLKKPTRVARKVARIFSLGFSAFLLEVAFGITAMVFNKQIIKHLSYDHLAVYGTVSTLLVMLTCVINAAGSALQPIASANFGAGRWGRVRASLKAALICGTVLGVVFLAVVELFPAEILRLFMEVNENVMLVGPPIMRVYCLALPLMGVTVVASYFHQSVLMQKMSVTVSLLRGILLPIGLALLLPSLFDVSIIWWCLPIAELVAFLLSVIFLLVSGRRIPKEDVRLDRDDVRVI